MDGELFLAPIGDNPQKIVDLGTGVGMWAQDGKYLPYPNDSALKLTWVACQSRRTSPVHVL